MKLLAFAAAAVLLCTAGAAQADARHPCGEGPPAALAAAAENTNLIDGMDHALFGRPERGWRIYETRIEADLETDLGAACIPESPVFALGVARWQAAHGLPADGVVRADTLAVFKAQWQAERPFLSQRLEGVCPASPVETALAVVPTSAGAGGENPLNPPRLHADALAALVRLRAAAAAELPEAAANPELLGLFSGFRSPAYDDGRCAKEGNCDGVARAACSPHRTGLAMDVFVGALPGFSADSSADENRLFQTHGAAYRWMLRNAGRFGFVNYAFEPWHWEWTGAPLP
jgi:hypothetical protein